MPNKKAAVGEIENQLSCNCVCLYQPWPWQNEEFPQTPRKGLAHSQRHRGAGQEAEKEWWGEIGGVPRLRIAGWEGWIAKHWQWQRQSSSSTALKEEAGGKLETLFSPFLAAFPSLCLCRKDEVSVWNVWVRRRRWMMKREGHPAAILNGLITGNRTGYSRHIYATT